MKKEIENVIKTEPIKKYEYFIKKVVDYEEIWALKDDEGWATLGDGEKLFLPIWAKREFSDLCISNEWSSYKSESIDLYEFLDEWISGLQKDKIKILVMWYMGEGIEVDVDDLKEDLEAELEKY